MCYTMDEEIRPKQTAFRLPQRTLDILDNIVALGKTRTRTDALILAVDEYITASAKIFKLESKLESLKESNNDRDERILKLIEEGFEYRQMIREIIEKGKDVHT